jgi:hypothetical protein
MMFGLIKLHSKVCLSKILSGGLDNTHHDVGSSDVDSDDEGS